ncbi:hypothetical protein FKW77_006755 [Venturia effusa]|uniref:F-box domain-containing protein n=1 Tax=Venturia effusa TaxID=50376 RepID=A0A517LDZ2_9PEZI|nr:hypothetical protein FKW77_006755 [Venturia effusa]
MIESQHQTAAPATARTVDLSSGSLPIAVTDHSPEAILFQAPLSDHSTTDSPRYPKRKRSHVAYIEIDEDDVLLSSDGEEEYEAKAKRRRKSNKPLPKHKIFPFMNLPAELRNRIYFLALADDDGDVYVTSTTKGYRRIAKRCTQPDCIPQFSRGHRSYRRYMGNRGDDEEEAPARIMNSFVPNLLTVSKTVHAEAASFLYGQRINFADNYSLLSFLNQIGREHTSMLREICIKEWCSGRAHRSINFPAMTLLASATNLEHLDIDCSMGYFTSYGREKLTAPIRAARKAFRDCYPWFEAAGKVKGRPDAAIDMIKVHPSNFGMGNYFTISLDLDEGRYRENLTSFQKELRRLLMT